MSSRHASTFGGVPPWRAAFWPSPAHLRRHDPYHPADRRLFGGVLLLLLASLAVLGLLVWRLPPSASTLWTLPAIVPLVVSAAAIYGAYRTMRGSAYEGDLVPALVVATAPLTVCCLAYVYQGAGTGRPAATQARWAVRQLRPAGLGMAAPPAIGQQLPAVAVLSNLIGATYRSVECRLLSWATPDPALLQAARESVPAEQWALLTALAARYEASPHDATGLAYFGAAPELRALAEPDLKAAAELANAAYYSRPA